MTDNELFLLAAGVSIGSNLTLLAWIAIDYVSGRRADRRRSQKADRVDIDTVGFGAAPDTEPHPAELLEASVRDFELKLYDGLDRVEDAARRGGLL
jgi:hypothetical protein